MKFEVTLNMLKETPGTFVYSAPRVTADGKPNATTSIYLNKDVLGGQKAPSSIKITLEA